MIRAQSAANFLWRAVPFAIAGGVLAYGVVANSQSVALNRVKIEIKGDERCIEANGLPDHAVGRFPNPGNPNSIRKQDYEVCVPVHPAKLGEPRRRGGSVAIAVNGILIRPDTADYYDPSSPRGFSRSGDRRWWFEAMANGRSFGVDQNNAHVDPIGLYHYHGIPWGLVKRLGSQGSADPSLIGWAADGFEVHYLGDKVKASYKLKDGTRDSGPGGKYDGRFIADWQFAPGAGDLDQCNGGSLPGDKSGEPGGKYVYFVTSSYPFWPRCLFGRASSDFPEHPRPSGGMGPGMGPPGMGPPPGPTGQDRDFGPPAGGPPPFPPRR